jgi:threonine/homoserine efflux transporter RhtA
MVCALPHSSVGNGVAQALDYVALDESGVQLYVILHSMAKLFACIIAVLLLRMRVTHGQWVAVIRCNQRQSEAIIRSHQRPMSGGRGGRPRPQ